MPRLASPAARHLRAPPRHAALNVRLVIFDCDGVLIDSEPIANRVLHEQLALAGLRIPLEEVMRRFIGRTRQGCLDHATELLGSPLPVRFAESWDAALFSAFQRELRAVDGVENLLKGLQLPYCVASNSSPARMQASLKAARLLPYFEGRTFSAAEVAHPKPAPDLFLHAARTMKCGPAECIVIEDTPTGARAGAAAGMKVYGYAAGVPAHAKKLKNEGAVPFDAMHELADQLRQIGISVK